MWNISGIKILIIRGQNYFWPPNWFFINGLTIFPTTRDCDLRSHRKSSQSPTCLSSRPSPETQYPFPFLWANSLSDGLWPSPLIFFWHSQIIFWPSEPFRYLRVIIFWAKNIIVWAQEEDPMVKFMGDPNWELGAPTATICFLRALRIQRYPSWVLNR